MCICVNSRGVYLPVYLPVCVCVCISVYARGSITAYRLGTHIYVSVLVSIYVQTHYTGTYGVCTGLIYM